jgi:8-oxo-dGTP pyrophosphatase MutT (NUDIX family)
MLEPNEAADLAAETPRDSATIVVLRQAERTVELFCVERHPRSQVLGGAIVFPGGKVDAADWEDCWGELTTSLQPRARAFGEERAARAFAVAALRELLEEAAILPVTGAGVSHHTALELQSLLASVPGTEHEESLAFAELLRARGNRLATDRLEALWRWITPQMEARRYDTRFYLLALPEGQLGRHDERETTRSFWATPEQLLERWGNSEIVLAPPTFCTIALLRAARSVDEAFTIARRQSLQPICPVACFEGGQMVIALPGDPLHPDDALEGSADVSAPTRFVVEDGRLVARRVQRPSR